MASETEVPELSSMFERLLSRHRDLSLFIPFILGLASATTRENPEQNPQEDSDQEPTQPASGPTTTTPLDRIILINPFTQGTVVIEGAPGGFDSLLRDFLLGSRNVGGQPPASKASIEAMPSVEIGRGEDGGGECVICLEEWMPGEVVKEMPCKHRFHGDCVEKWLGIHGSCPVCRYKMPVEEEELGKKRDDEEEGGEGGRERRRIEREIWVSFSLSGSRRNEDSNQTPSTDSSDVSSRSSDPEIEG